MRKAHLHLIKYALNRGNTISVYVDGDAELSKSTNITKVRKIVNEYEIATILIYPPGSATEVAWALLTPHEAPEETVCDYSDNEWMEQWQKAYDRYISGLTKRKVKNEMPVTNRAL